ncbi:hypothetical protein B296_00028530 [Ensete ventricosum]|uniref:BRCT domain-containing protein n=1 Tax=Ensete ventricosum TaxID=4639 RepID=A0A427AMH7_ENSVE|nr:hypothetical protein B296_00028530 [Ensete ventricosum]
MAPRRGAQKRQRSPTPDPDGMFQGMVVFMVPKGVQPRRLQVWKQKLTQMGAVVDDNVSKRVTHIFAMNSSTLLQQVNLERLHRHTGSLLHYQWLENCLRLGEKIAEDPYVLKFQGVNGSDRQSGKISPEPSEARYPDDELPSHKRIKDSPKVVEGSSMEENRAKKADSTRSENQHSGIHGQVEGPSMSGDSLQDTKRSYLVCYQADVSQSQSPYNPPDLNRNITEIFGKLINIYRGTEEIHEIVTTGKLSKLEHFENDDKVMTMLLTSIFILTFYIYLL